MSKASKRDVSPSDLPTKSVRAPDGSVVRMKVVKADSKTLSSDLLAAFRSNVRRVRESRPRGADAAADSS